MKHPAPALSGELQPFWEEPADAAGALSLPWCADCAIYQWPRRARCRCGATTSWKSCSGKGALLSWSVVRRATHPDLQGDVPYLTAFVALDIGVRLFTNLIGITPEEAREGLRVCCTRDALLLGDRLLQIPVFIRADRAPHATDIAQTA